MSTNAHITMVVVNVIQIWMSAMSHAPMFLVLIFVNVQKDITWILRGTAALVCILYKYIKSLISFLYVDVNECLENNGGCGCDPHLTEPNDCNAACYNSPGSFTCDCLEGYYLDNDNKTCKGSELRHK